jgi:excisionase family DNA binding protein
VYPDSSTLLGDEITPWSGAMTTDDFISIAEAAELLFVSQPHLRELIARGSLLAVQCVAGELRVRKADVLMYKERQLADAKSWLAGQTEED